MITSSSMGTLQACAENYRLRYIAGLEAIEKPRTLYIGSVFHDAVEVLRKGGSLHDMLGVLAGNGMSADDVCLLTVMIEAYHQKYRREAGNFAEVEMEFYHEALGSDVTLAGKVDAIAKATPGHLLYETKTVARIDGGYLDRLWSARQTLVYNRVLNQMGYDIQGVMYDLVGKPTIKRLLATPVEKRRYTKDKGTGQMRLHAKQRDQDESDSGFLSRLREWYRNHPEALHRELIIYTEEQLDSIEQDVRNEVKRLQWHIQSGVWPRSLSSCHRFNRPCEFSPLCQSGGNSLVLETHYQRRDKIHSELEGKGEDK
jgi:hypothetical protein